MRVISTVMVMLRAFKPLRPRAASAAAVSAPPYDVLNREEAKSLAQHNPLSFLHVSRPEIDLPDSINPYAAQVYEKAAENLSHIARSAPLERDERDCIYIYELTFQNRSQTGIAATYSIDEYDCGIVKKHEKTRQDKEDDRTRHILAIKAQSGPVFLTYSESKEVQSLVESEKRAAPFIHFTASDGIQHVLWRISDPDKIKKLILGFHSIPSLYIADGHHRAASASRTRRELAANNKNHRGDENYNYFLAVAFPANELKILPYNRVIKDWNGLTSERFLEKLSSVFTLTPDANPNPPAGEYSLYLEKRWYGIKLKNPVAQAASSQGKLSDQLDVSILQNLVLEPFFGIQDPRKDSRIDFVGGIRGTAELERLVDSRFGVVAFSLHPTTMEQLMRVSDAGEIMPPKSTWFEPKLRDGLLTHVIAE